ncbi:Trk system potassium transporter TrkA [Natronorubrum thiooxidans]|uniref:Trk system potassium uptake protein TrkA n=1 Tax=Natronorubrum thiooxidans TaxID=308853 RepID=A0A1N7GME6_9EURY|nr:Trk system potassium transporter TrkA [Natronorubrum thiooxidans]SIS13764.1 trk system potassium uptake protein TrkA [Natronorubrum thiooxidans]
MYVIVVGAGEVGWAIAATLQESHDVAVIDRDGTVVAALTNSMDVLAVHGDGSEIDTLRAAGLDDVDLVVACTDNDETNIVICGAAKIESDAFTIARVSRYSLLETWGLSEGWLGVDFMVCTDILVAQAICRISGLPAVQDVDIFAGGLVRMAEFDVKPGSSIANRAVREIDIYDSLTFAALFRGDEMLILTGESVIEAGDRIVVIGSPDAIDTFADDLTIPDHEAAKEIVILGASVIGFHVAREFEAHEYRTRLIEHDHERAREAAEALPKTLVLETDATDTEFLASAHIAEADIVVAALDSDEKNLLVSLLAREAGVERTVAVIEKIEYLELFETVGVTVTINPREETAEQIVGFTRTDLTEKIAFLEHDRAEVIEVVVDADSVLAGRELAESTLELPERVVIGAISRDGELVTPRGATVVNPGDRLVVFVDTAVLEEARTVL